MNKENCVILNKHIRNNVIKLNRIALVDKNNRNEINNKINESDTMNNESSNRVLRARTNPRLTEPKQYPLIKGRSKSTTSNINEIHMKSVRVSLVRDQDIDRFIRTPTRLDVYEFQYDPKDEPPRKTKQKRAKTKRIDSDTSEDENNSMKDVMKTLRRRWRKPKSGGPKCTKAQKTIKTTIETPVRKLDQNKLVTSTLLLFEKPAADAVSKAIIQTTTPAENHIDPNFDDSTDSSFCNPNPNVSILLNKPPQHPNTLSNNTQNIDFDALFNISSQNLGPTPKPTQYENPKAISPPDKPSSKHCLSPAKTAQDVVQEVMDSFVEDDHPKTPIKVYSNVLLQSPCPAIFNSTLATPLASPWRLNLSNIYKHSYCFTVKKNSFTPAYDQDIIDHSRRKSHVYTNIGAGSYAPDQSISKESHEKHMSNHSTTKSVEEQEKQSLVAFHEPSTNEILSKSLKTHHQSSILSFMKSSKTHPSPSPSKARQIGLFDELLPDRPRKALGSLNTQSTPFKKNTRASISDISAEKSSDDSMFGFSYLSDKENSGATKQKCSPARISLREIKNQPNVVAASGGDVMQTKLNEVAPETSEIQRKSIEIDTFAVDDSSVGLFQDCEPELEVSKKINRNYTRKQPKRKRLPSVGSNHSDDESDDETRTRHVKKKQKDKLTKQEQIEVDRLAKHYNSMFEDIAKHHLIIE